MIGRHDMTALPLISRTKCPRSLAMVVASILCVFEGPLKAQPATDPQTQIDQLRKELAELKTAFEAFKSDSVKIEEELSEAASVILPVGSIAAYSGPISGLAKIPNWLPCDGRTVSGDQYPVLWDRLKTTWGGAGKTSFKLPDLQGLFLRGVDGTSSRDPDVAANSRTANGNGERNTVGTTESDSTRMPVIPFQAALGGAHDHEIPIKTFYFVAGGQGSGPNKGPTWLSALSLYQDQVLVDNRGGFIQAVPRKLNTTPQAGQHGHTINGGDSESRPKNAAVFWIIRVQ